MKKLRTIAATIAISTSITSCVTDPYSGQHRPNKTAAGALVGAVGGAALGAVYGNNKPGGKSRKYAVIGGLMGAAVGGSIGDYMNQQEQRMRRDLRGSGVSISRVGNNLVLNMPSDITFSTGRANIQPRFSNTLSSVASVLRNYNRTQVSIVGHTDSDGSHAMNQRLSRSRATSVANFLNRRGVTSNRIITSVLGESSPIASNHTAAGKAQNRRVEIRIVPQQSQFRR